MTIKAILYQQCVALVKKRKQNIVKQISEIQQNLLSETKSSAGDKYETGRAMLHLERENAGHQLAEINKLETECSQLRLDIPFTKVGLGSLVFTSTANYYISLSLGALHAQGEVFYAISPLTPIGQLLMGEKEGDEVNFKGKPIIIKKVE